jgi:hypothetical protein
METLSARAYAKHRMVSHTAVLKAIKTGRISKTSDGKIDVAAADASWLKKTEPQVQQKHNAKQPDKSVSIVCPVVRTREATIESEAVPGDQPILDGLDYFEARAVTETYKARLARLDYELRTGQLIRAEQVEEAAMELARTVRDSLLNLPDRLAAILAAESDPAKTHKILTDELRKALNELATHDAGDGPAGAVGLSQGVQPRAEA